MDIYAFLGQRPEHLLRDAGMEVIYLGLRQTTESIVITQDGVECLTDYPRKLFVKD